MAGRSLRGPGLALRGRDTDQPHQTGRPYTIVAAQSLRLRIRRLLCALAPVRSRRALSRIGCQGSQGEPETAPVLPARSGLLASRHEGESLQCFPQGRQLARRTLPHQVQHPHPPERGICRSRHHIGSERTAPHDPLRPQQGLSRPGILRDRQPVSVERRHIARHRELHHRCRQVDTQRHRQGHKPDHARRPVLRPRRIRSGPAALRRGSAGSCPRTIPTIRI